MMMRSTRISRPFVLAFLATLAVACAGPEPVEEAPAPTALTGWRIDTTEHIALWYHGLAYVRGTVDARDSIAVPRFAPGYADSMTAIKRRRGVYPTALDRRVEEFRELLAGDAYRGLEFVPLYFRSSEALYSAVDIWNRAGGDPRRVASADAARVVAFLSRLFPRSAQRKTVVEWTGVIREEATSFYDAFWQEQQPLVRSRTVEVRREWDALAPALADYLDYLELRRGEVFLVPALGAEGRLVTQGIGVPTAAVLDPPAGRPDAAVFSFVHELVYPVVGEVVRDYVAPVRIREIGEDLLTSRAAVRGGALLLDRVAPERADAYRRFFLEATGRTAPPARATLEEAFIAAFPLPREMVPGLEAAIDRALAGI